MGITIRARNISVPFIREQIVRLWTGTNDCMNAGELTTGHRNNR